MRDADYNATLYPGTKIKVVLSEAPITRKLTRNAETVYREILVRRN